MGGILGCRTEGGQVVRTKGRPPRRRRRHRKRQAAPQFLPPITILGARYRPRGPSRPDWDGLYQITARPPPAPPDKWARLHLIAEVAAFLCNVAQMT